VSTNDVLPLNKPIIPLEKITKYDHGTGKNSAVSLKPKTPLSIFNANAHNLAPGASSPANQKKPPKASQILDEATKKQLLHVVDKFLSEHAKNEENSAELSAQILSEAFEALKDLKLSSDKLSEAVRLLITHSLSKQDSDRLRISQLFIRLHRPEADTARDGKSLFNHDLINPFVID
jgi:hypothetical protein